MADDFLLRNREATEGCEGAASGPVELGFGTLSAEGGVSSSISMMSGGEGSLTRTRAQSGLGSMNTSSDYSSGPSAAVDCEFSSSELLDCAPDISADDLDSAFCCTRRCRPERIDFMLDLTRICVQHRKLPSRLPKRNCVDDSSPNSSFSLQYSSMPS